jgi:nucleotide-binding universal stress UspA family protein
MKRIFSEVEGPEVKVDFHVVEGRAVPEIIRYAEYENADLIVIATHGLTGIEHLLLGSVTEKVVRLAPCPVFTVKAFGKSLIV